ncbi:D-sedoheptulose 7-phosphate isomerase [Candidatus Blochmannia ocreatus]|uniref:D-sedoheptulose 7-phosphate isomerase n=1 Tax=Candidatus Blochmannia ocreatus (nom. nud.) TaxID=251538 RepID=A0ABY4T012_9ENTR|nr:D-sedoheptulose 7-phosphate isomerase [Candidatus Blochmannia ocreatus]
MKIIQQFSDIPDNINVLISSAKLIANAFKKGGKALSCGNGGSHCNAMHFAEELTGRYRNNRSGYAAIAISDPSYLSCVSNDFGYEHVFSRYIESVGNKEDILLAISTSGDSINILNAIKSAHNKKMKTIFLTGKKNKENNFLKYVNHIIYMPHASYLDHIQEVHIKIIHLLILIIEKEMSTKAINIAI